MNIVNAMSDKEFKFMRPLYDLMTSYESCTGMSNHALLVCKSKYKTDDLYCAMSAGFYPFSVFDILIAGRQNLL